MGNKSKKIECLCHRCKYWWQYHEMSKFIASCPRCKMTVYIPKMFRLVKENRGNCGIPTIEVKEKKTLNVRSDSSMTSSYNQAIYE